MGSEQYVGRTFDVLAFTGAKPAGNVLLTQTLFGAGNSGSVCTGIQKMAQRWLLEFSTIRNSMPWHLRNRGTNFMLQVQKGTLKTEADVQAAYVAAAIQVRQNLTNEDTGNEPDDERFDRSKLNGIVIGDGQLHLHVTLYSVAGTDYTIILPIQTTPANLVI
jgi:hypothetical protein